MKRWTVLFGLFAGFALGAGFNAARAQHEHGTHAQADKGEKAKLPACPVMGEPIDVGVSTMTDDGPVYFCCPSCIKKLKENPDKYAEAVAAQRKALTGLPKVQVTCPVSGKPVDKKVSIEHDGQTVYFCCQKCPSAFQADPAKYRAKLAGSYSYQTTCPVSGEEISPTSFTELADGHKVYFCCDKCSKKLVADPAKYAPDLKEQGIYLDLEKLTRSETGHAEGEGAHEHGEHEHEH